MNDAVREMAEWFRREDGFTFLAHGSPDGDTIGSCLALYAIVKAMGRKAQVACEHIVPPQYTFLPDADCISKPEALQAAYRNVIAVDCASEERMGGARTLFEAAEETGNIDHHLSNERFGKHVLHSDTAAATGELVFYIWKLLQPELACSSRRAMDIACCLFVAISTDTGNFSYSNTTPETFRIGAELTQAGIDIAEINRRVYKTVPIGKARLKGFVLGSMRLYDQGRIGLASITMEDLLRTGACVEDIEGMVESIRDVDTVEVAILLREKKDGGYKASLRSKRYVNVALLAEKFGGGGHVFAAGMSFKEGSLQEHTDRILAAARQML